MEEKGAGLSFHFLLALFCHNFFLENFLYLRVYTSVATACPEGLTSKRFTRNVSQVARMQRRLRRLVSEGQHIGGGEGNP